MFIGHKIKNLTKARGLLIKTLVEKWGIEPHHFSRMLREKLVFNDKKVAIAAAFLNVSEDYLRDESRPFNKGDRIPEDVVTTPPPTTEVIDPVAALERLAEKNMEHRKTMDSQGDAGVLAEVSRELVFEIGSLTTEMRLLREEFKRMRDESAGDHDTD